MRARLTFVVVIGLGLLGVDPAHAQYSISWSTIAGGGGTSVGTSDTGTDYRLSGTIGQHDAGELSLCSGLACVGATYELTGGFWTGVTGDPTPGVGCGANLDCIFRDGFESP
jgi:hypothetical protein